MTMPNPAITINSLQLFSALNRVRNLSAAARDLHIVPSAASQQLTRLEAGLGKTLFLRRRSGLILTPEGEAFRQRVLPLWENLQAGLNDLADNGTAELHGSLRIGSLREFAEGSLMPFLLAFSKRHPRVEFELTLGGHVQLIEELDRGRLDIVLSLATKTTTEKLRSYRVVQQRALVLGSSKRALRPDLPPEFVSYRRHDPLVERWLHARFGARRANHMRAKFICDSHRSLIDYLRAHPTCVGVLPESSAPVAEALRLKQLSVLEKLTNPIDIHYHRLEDHFLPPRFRVFENDLREHFRASR